MKERDVGRRYNIENKIFVKERLRDEKTMMMLVMAIICMKVEEFVVRIALVMHVVLI